MTQYFMVLRDYQSEQRPRIMHGYKAGQILTGYADSRNVYLSGATTAELVFGRPACSESKWAKSDNYSQCLHACDVVEMEIVSLDKLGVGDVAYTKNYLPSNIAEDGSENSQYGVVAGGVFTVLAIDNGSEHYHLQFGETFDNGLWFVQRHLKVATFFRVKKLEKAVDTEQKPQYTVKHKAEEVKPRTKVVYEVQLSDGTSILLTKNRKRARAIKATLGGKEKGVVIIQYNAHKEVR